jgi:hypothetical protein
MTGELVYVRGQRGLAPEKWPAGHPAGTRLAPLARHALSDAEWQLSLPELVRRYPPPPYAQTRCSMR